jgi:SAM-dependent methyltransferase
MGTDFEWEKWGAQDPYFAVITFEKFRRERLTDDVKREFFESGKRHLDHVLQVCRDHLDPEFSPKRALDFGCGVGRVVLPLAQTADYVVGLDVADSMLAEARRNCEDHSLRNVSLLKSDDDLSCVEGSFDLIHSVIVFQHIDATRGRRIFSKLLQHLGKGGIGVIHFLYSKTVFKENHGLEPRPKAWGLPRKLKRLVQKIVRGRSKAKDPEMQMNPYNINEVLFLLQAEGVDRLYVEFTDHVGDLGVCLYFQRPR